MKIDYGGVPFVLDSSLKDWLTQFLGTQWFGEVDPMLQAIRNTFSHEGHGIVRVELYRAPDTGFLYAKRIKTDGNVWQDRWVFSKNARGSSFCLAA